MGDGPAGQAGDLAAVDIRILGPLEVVVDRRPLALGGAKQRATLALLLLDPGRTVTLDALVDGLWPGRPPASAANTLQSYLSRLRRTLEQAGAGDRLRLASRPGGYAAEADPAHLDAHRFSAHAAEGRALLATDARAASDLLRRALGTWRGPVLADLADWDFARREAARLDELRLAALEDLADAELALGEHAAVVARLEPLAAAHPFRERLWGQLILALYRDGRQAEALRRYDRLRRALADELGISPGPALRALEQQVLLQSPSLAGPPPPPPRPAAPAPRPARPAPAPAARPVPADAFVGRDEQLAALRAEADAAAAGRGRLVVVVGDAGMGKTALLRRFLADAPADGTHTVCGRAWEEDGAPPFWPWVEALRTLPPPCNGAVDLHQVLGVVAPATVTPDDAQARFRLFDAVAERLADAAADRPLVVGLEDLHGADAASLLLLRFVARRLADLPVLVVATARPPAGPDTPLATTLAELAREPVTRQIVLAPLGDDDVARLLEARLGGPVPDQVVASVQRWGEGHPFYLAELVHLLRAHPHGPAPALAADRLDVPHGVAQMIARRLAPLPDDTVRALAVASVVGREVDVRLLEQVAHVRGDALLDALEHARHAHLVEALPPPRAGYRFGHALVREALYDGVGPVRRARLHQRIAEALEAGAGGPPEERIAEVAFHRCASATEGAAGVAVAAAVRAARRALAHLAFEEGARLYRLALDTAAATGEGVEDRGELLLGLGEAQRRAGDLPASRASLRAAAEVARAEGDAVLLGHVALAFGGGFEARMFDAELVALLEEALAALPTGPAALRARLLARLAMAVYLDDPTGRRLELSRQALAAARASGDGAALAAALGARSFALWGPDHVDERAAAAGEALRLAEHLGDRDLALDGLTWSAMEALERGDRAAFDATAARHAHAAEEQRHPLHRYYAEMWRGMASALEGRLDEAEEHAHRAHALGAPLTEMAMPRRSVLLLAVLRDRGRLSELVDDADTIVTSFPLFAAVWGAARAFLRLELGDDGPARLLLQDPGHDPLASLPRDANWVSGVVFLSEICGRLGDERHAGALYERLLPYRRQCGLVRFGPACWGALSRYLGILAATTGRWDLACHHFEDAIARNRRLGAGPLTARTEVGWAAALLQRDAPGDRRCAESLLASAERAAHRFGMPRLLEDVAAASQ